MLLALGLIASIATAHASSKQEKASEHDDSAVLVLTSENFESTIQEHGKTGVLVKFYAPWCGHCKSMAPAYADAANQLKGKSVLAKVDCTTENDLCGKYGVRGFPTLKWITSAGVIDYESGREVKSLIDFVNEYSSSPVTVVDAKRFEDVLSSTSKNILVGLHDASDEEFLTNFDTIATALRAKQKFVSSSDALLKSKFGVDKLPAVVLLPSFDRTHVLHEGAIHADDVTEFVQREGFPAFAEIGPENYQDYVEREFPVVYVFVQPDEIEAGVETSPVLSAVNKVAPEYRKQLSLVFLDGVKFVNFLENFGTTDTPTIVIAGERFRFMFKDPEVNPENVKKFLDGFLKGELEPHIKSEEIPAKNDGPVKVVVAHTFDEIVFDGSKDVFVEFYAPWCKHCKELAPEFEKLGKKFASHETVVIAKIDATKNDVPVEVEGFPTMMLFSSSSKEGIRYEGERKAAAIESWLLEQLNAEEKYEL
jgi:protein disulfide-isomerase A1